MLYERQADVFCVCLKHAMPFLLFLLPIFFPLCSNIHLYPCLSSGLRTHLHLSASNLCISVSHGQNFVSVQLSQRFGQNRSGELPSNGTGRFKGPSANDRHHRISFRFGHHHISVSVIVEVAFSPRKRSKASLFSSTNECKYIIKTTQISLCETSFYGL